MLDDNSFFGPTLRQSKHSLNYELFPRYDSGTHSEHTKRALLSERHKVSCYTCACNCIYVHKVEVWPCVRRFSRNSPSFNKVMWKSHVLNYQNRTQHSRETGIFPTMPLHKIWLSLERFSRNLPRVNGVLWRCAETHFMKSGQELCKETEWINKFPLSNKSMSLPSRLHAHLYSSPAKLALRHQHSPTANRGGCACTLHVQPLLETLLRTLPTVLKFQRCKIPGTQKPHYAATVRHLTTCPVTRLCGDTTGRFTSARNMSKSGVGWRYFAWTCCCLILLNSVLFIKAVSKFVNLDLSWSIVLKPLFQPYLAVSDEEKWKWDHVAAKSASPALLLRRSLSAQSPLAFIKWRWTLSCPMERTLLQSSIQLLLPKVRIFLKNKVSHFLCIVGLFCIFIAGI
jgi:hypothetical protein